MGPSNLKKLGGIPWLEPFERWSCCRGCHSERLRCGKRLLRQGVGRAGESWLTIGQLYVSHHSGMGQLTMLCLCGRVLSHDD